MKLLQSYIEYRLRQLGWFPEVKVHVPHGDGGGGRGLGGGGPGEGGLGGGGLGGLGGGGGGFGKGGGEQVVIQVHGNPLSAFAREFVVK